MIKTNNQPVFFEEMELQTGFQQLPPISQVLTEHLSQEDFNATAVTYYEVHTQPRAIHIEDVAILPAPLFTLQRVRIDTPLQALRRRIKRESGLELFEKASLKEEEDLKLFPQEVEESKQPEISPVLAFPGSSDDILSSMLHLPQNELQSDEKFLFKRHNMAVVQKTETKKVKDPKSSYKDLIGAMIN